MNRTPWMKFLLACVLLNPLAALSAESALRLLVVSHPHVPLADRVAKEVAVKFGAPQGVRRSVIVRKVEMRSGQAERAFAQEIKPLLDAADVVFSTELYLARAIQFENGLTPIVFDGVADALSLCLVDSLRRPGRNATGYMHYLIDEEAKLVETIVQGFPAIRHLVVLLSGHNVSPTTCSPDDPAWGDISSKCVAGSAKADSELRALINVDTVRRVASALDVEVSFSVLCDVDDIKRVAQGRRSKRDHAYLVPWHGLFVENAALLVDYLNRTRRPVIFARHQFSALGGIVSIEPTVDPQDDRASFDLLVKVLEGRPPADLPVQTPRGFSVHVNASAAAAQGLRPSLLLLRRADVILQNASPR
jgi:putative tryptophan/tyrosine transport system substrate-binding protein